MVIAGFILVAVTLVGIACQLRLVTRYARQLAAPPPRPRDAAWPAAAVVLSVRGSEQGLTECLDRVALLDYPEFEIHVVVDHDSDPCMPVVCRWRRQHPELRVVIHTLADPSSGATLKCSAVHQAISAVDPRIEAVVLLDADAHVYPGWLQDMILPTLDGSASMATGNRWYDPTAHGIGSLLRFLYNANAVIPMHAGRMTWGGSLALRRDVFSHPAFLDSLRRSPTEDASVHEALADLGKQLAMATHVMLLSTDSITADACLRFMRRQLLWTRLYHVGWPLIAGGAVTAYAVALAATAALVWAVVTGNQPAALAFATTLATAILGNLLVVERLHRAIGGAIEARQGRTVRPIDTACRLRLLAAVPLSLPAFTFAAVAAWCARRVRWSGIDYDVQPPRGLRMVAYRPFVDRPATA